MSLTNANSVNFRHQRNMNPQREKNSPRTPGWGSWLAFLFIGVCALALAYTEQLIAWSLSQGIANEGSTQSLLANLRYAGIAGVLLGAITAWRIWLWAIQTTERWAPVRALIFYLAPALNPVVRLVWATVSATVLTPARWTGTTIWKLGWSLGRGLALGTAREAGYT